MARPVPNTETHLKLAIAHASCDSQYVGKLCARKLRPVDPPSNTLTTFNVIEGPHVIDCEGRKWPATAAKK